MKNILLNKRLKLNRPLILDGAIGSLVQQRGLPVDKHLWASYTNLICKDEIKNIHLEYINAGADILTTNTFRTNPVALLKSEYDFTPEYLVNQSVNLLKELNSSNNFLIAGSNAPAEDCYQKERTIHKSVLEYNHKKHIELLYANGVDFILNETLSHIDEIDIIANYCNKNEIPFVVSLYFENKNTLLDNTPIEEAINLINDNNPLAISFNCIDFQVFAEFIDEIDFNFNNGLYFNCGNKDKSKGNLDCVISPEEYYNTINKFINESTLFIGSCCLSNPNHTEYLRRKFDKVD